MPVRVSRTLSQATARRLVAFGLLIAAVVSVLMLAGCTPQPPGREPDMSLARVTDSTQIGEEWSLLIKVPEGEHERIFGHKAAYAGYDAAVVRVNAKTTLAKMSGNQLADATIEEVLDAEHLSVWFEGPVAESYPVQGAAAYIEITD